MISIHKNRYLITHQPLAGLTERLQWASRVSTAYNGNESRKSLRCNPEVTLTMRHRVDQTDRTMVQSVINTEIINDQRIQWWCPLWHLSFDVPATAFDGTTGITLTDPLEHGFDETGECVVYDLRGYAFMLRSYTLAMNTLTLSMSVSTITRPFSIAALREANLVGERGLAGTLGDDELTMSYRLTRPLKVDKSSVEQFDSLDVMSIPTEETNPDDADEKETVVSFQTGSHDVIRRREQPVATSRLAWVGQWGDSNPREDIATFRRWLWKREGRTVPFLTPNFYKSLKLESVTASTITLSEGLDTFTLEYLQKVSPYIALIARLNTVAAYLKIEQSSATSTSLTIESGTVDPTVTYSYGSLVIPARLRNDVVEFVWTTDRYVSTTLGLQSFFVKEGDVKTGVSACVEFGGGGEMPMTFGCNVTVTSLSITGMLGAREFPGMVGTVTEGLIYGGDRVSRPATPRWGRYSISGNNVSFTALMGISGQANDPRDGRIGPSMVGDTTSGLIVGGVLDQDRYQALSRITRYNVTNNTYTLTDLNQSGATLPVIDRAAVIGDVSAGLIFSGQYLAAGDNIRKTIYRYVVSGNNVMLTSMTFGGAVRFPTRLTQVPAVAGDTTAGLMFFQDINDAFYLMRYDVSGDTITLTNYTLVGATGNANYARMVVNADLTRCFIFGGERAINPFIFCVSIVDSTATFQPSYWPGTVLNPSDAPVSNAGTLSGSLISSRQGVGMIGDTASGIVYGGQAGLWGPPYTTDPRDASSNFSEFYRYSVT